MSWLESFLQWSAEIDLKFWLSLLSVWFLIFWNFFIQRRIYRLEDYANSLLFRVFELEKSLQQTRETFIDEAGRVAANVERHTKFVFDDRTGEVLEVPDILRMALKK